jgi:UDP-glucuronate 4-epimerase
LRYKRQQEKTDMPETIIVTGAAGFIGSHLCERLVDEGKDVVGIDNFSDFYPREVKQRNLESRLLGARQFQFVEMDIRDRQAVESIVEQSKPERIVHLAAMAGVRPSIENPGLYTEVNLDGTVRLLDAAVAGDVKKFIFASSSSVYGNNPKVPFAETDPVDHPISPYAATKRAGELVCHSYWHLYQMPIACLRFFTVFGPRQRPDLAIAKFFRLLEQGQAIPLFGDGTTSRDYTYIDDIIEGVRAAMDRIEGYRIYNLGGNHPVTLAELLAAVEETTGTQAAIDRKPLQPGDVDRTYADLARSSSELDYRPRTSLGEGLASQWQWYRSVR